MRIIFISFIDRNKTQVMHAKSHNVEIMNGTDTSDAINKLISSFMKRYQEGLETKMKGSSYVFERIDLLEYHLHKISLNRGSSYIDSPIWIKNKGVTINPDNNCLQHAIITTLNYQNISHHSERISKIKPFINNYSWTDIEFPSHSKDWRKFECNNKAIALNILYVPYKTEKIRQAYISEHNDKRNNQVNLIMITDGTNNWHYLAIKNLSGLLRGITSNHNSDFYFLSCLHSYGTISKPGKKSLKNAFIIYVDLECLLLKMSTCNNNNPNKPYATAKVLHKPSGYSLLTSCSFDKSENKQTYYRGKDCMKRFCDDLKEHVTRITNYEMKPIDPLTKEEEESYKNQEQCHICEKEFCTDNNKEMRKVRDHCHYTGKYRGTAHSKCKLNYKIVKEIPVLFHNGSVYDYHFIIKYLARELKGNSECLGENTETYINFTVPFKKVINDKDIKYRIRISDSCRFMQDSLSNIVDNLSELKIKEIDNDVLIKRFYDTYQLSGKDINKFKLLLRKGVYPYEYRDGWKRFNETELPSKDKLNLEYILDDNYAYAINVWNTFNVNNLGEYHDLYVKLDTALLGDIFENFRDKHVETDKLDPAYFLTTPVLSWWACLKKQALN